MNQPATKKQKKAFALEQIKPYYKDPWKCGFENDSCVYKTMDGRMCVVGKNLLNPDGIDNNLNVSTLLDQHEQSDVFKPESVNILTDSEWRLLQCVHDAIAKRWGDKAIAIEVKSLGLFKMGELQS